MSPSPRDNDLSRREFTRLTLAALAGLTAGSGASIAADPKREVVKSLMFSEPHICRGLNVCKGRGADRKNKCAGMGTCATARYHTCKGHNDCRGQGGCSEEPGENSCRGLGACDVPLKPLVWQKARRRFEHLMKLAGRDIGAAPTLASNTQK